MSIVLEPIGVIHSPFREPVGMPIQPRFAAHIQNRLTHLFIADTARFFRNLSCHSFLQAVDSIEQTATFSDVVPFYHNL